MKWRPFTGMQTTERHFFIFYSSSSSYLLTCFLIVYLVFSFYFFLSCALSVCLILLFNVLTRTLICLNSEKSINLTQLKSRHNESINVYQNFIPSIWIILEICVHFYNLIFHQLLQDSGHLSYLHSHFILCFSVYLSICVWKLVTSDMENALN